jgi:hypothetical protein
VVKADGPQLSLVSISALADAISLKTCANLVFCGLHVLMPMIMGAAPTKGHSLSHSGGNRDFPSFLYRWNNCRDALWLI